MSLEATLDELRDGAQSRITAANTVDELEAVRVDVLGRKGTLAGLSKEMGKVAAADRAAMGQRFNAVKQELESAYEGRKAGFDSAALNARLDSEWLDLTLPAPGIRPGAL